MSIEIPHKYKAEESSWSNNKRCGICKKKVGHPIHSKKYRNKPLKYHLAKEEGKIK